MEVLKYERTKAMQLITLPNIATNLKPYRLARADTKGPKQSGNSIYYDSLSFSLHNSKYGFLTFGYSVDWKCANHIRYILIIDPILINLLHLGVTDYHEY